MTTVSPGCATLAACEIVRKGLDAEPVPERLPLVAETE